MDAATYDYLLPFIGGHEGKVLKAYLDPVHVVTIGYGFTWSSSVFRNWWAKHRGKSKLKLGDTMTDAEAFEVLQLVLGQEYLPPVEKKFAGKKKTVIAAGSSMTYNCGNGALSWQWATLIAAGKLSEGIARWRVTGTTARGKKLPGLVKRRNEEADVASTGKWPSWVVPLSAGQIAETHTDQVDIAQAQRWLEELGYSPGGSDGVPGPRTKAAVIRFQTDHGQLVADGIIGPATLSALQRAVALKSNVGKTAAGGTGAVVAGGGEIATGAGNAVPDPSGLTHDLGWIGDLLLWGGLGLAVVVLIFFALRYKDEINNVLNKFA